MEGSLTPSDGVIGQLTMHNGFSHGPDAMVNYVLAHRKCNDAKGERTPFEWLRTETGWNAYVERVESRATQLRNKKVQLLLREDAPELVQRYTALAETAWVAKLAQKIVSLHFVWRNGVDGEGTKRVRCISGGLTARIRRKYRLNSLLAPMPDKFKADWLEKAAAKKGRTLTVEEATAASREASYEWESAAEKNRADLRHHALDAMVISFVPQWARDGDKERFFSFPKEIEKNARAFFERQVNQVTPRNIAFEKAALADTNYGARRGKRGDVIVQRVLLRELAMKPKAQGKGVFDLTYLRKQLNCIRDETIRKAVHTWCEKGGTEAEWEEFCKGYRLVRQDGSLGPRVIRVSMYVGEPDEYVEVSKDGTGTWRRGKGTHKGQILYWNAAGLLKVLPVFAHGSLLKELGIVRENGGRVYGYFQSDCAVRINADIPAGAYKLVAIVDNKKKRCAASGSLGPCELTLKTIVTKNFIAEMTLANGTRVVARLDVWVRAGLERVK